MRAENSQAAKSSLLTMAPVHTSFLGRSSEKALSGAMVMED